MATNLKPRAKAELLIRDPKGRVLVGQGIGGAYVFPGGGIDPGETPAQAAIREAKEEAGVSVSSVKSVMRPRVYPWSQSFIDTMKEKHPDRALEFNASKIHYYTGQYSGKGAEELGVEGDALKKMTFVPPKKLIKFFEAEAAKPGNEFAQFDRGKADALKNLAVREKQAELSGFVDELQKIAFDWGRFKEGLQDEGVPLTGAAIGAGIGGYLGRPLTGAALGYAGGSGASLLRSKLKGEQPTEARKILALSGLGYGLGGIAHGGLGYLTRNVKPGTVRTLFHGAEHGLTPAARAAGSFAEEAFPAIGATLGTGYALGSTHRKDPQGG